MCKAIRTIVASICLFSGAATIASDAVMEILQDQQRQIEELRQQLGEQERVLERLPRVDAPAASFDYASHVESEFHGGGYCDCQTHAVGYDKGFVIRPYCPEDVPFELKINGRLQARHTAFDRHARSYVDRASGATIPIDSRNDFEIERGRIAFGGFVHDPKLQFYLQIDLDTDDQHRAVAQDLWFNYEFSKHFDVYVGKAFIPGSREWLDGALKMRFGDRSLATTFFRPDRTIGLWAIGNITEKIKYRAMLGNGFQTADLRPNQIDDRFMVSASTWWEPLADFGSGYSDLEWHDDLALRLGSSFTHASNEGNPNGMPRAEQLGVRLSDGVRLTDANALAAGVTVNKFDINLLAVDLAAKYRGLSFNSEFYARWLNNFGATGSIPFTNIYTDGFNFDVGYMVCPETVEVAGRIGTINGMFGDAWEYAGGVNLFFNGHNNKLTFDVTYLDGSPANNSGTNYRVGDKGVMFRSAWQVAF